MKPLFKLNVARMVALAVAVAVTATELQAADVPRPNVVVIVADDK